MTKLIWHIDRAKFVFDNQDDFTKWQENPEIFFEFSPTSADEPGEDLFEDVYDIEIYRKVDDEESKTSFTVEADGVVVSAWIAIHIETTEDFDEESFSEWAEDFGGWYSASISLGDFEASIIEDDGGDFRIHI
jgi:hypothetical protein